MNKTLKQGVTAMALLLPLALFQACDTPTYTLTTPPDPTRNLPEHVSRNSSDAYKIDYSPYIKRGCEVAVRRMMRELCVSWVGEPGYEFYSEDVRHENEVTSCEVVLKWKAQNPKIKYGDPICICELSGKIWTYGSTVVFCPQEFNKALGSCMKRDLLTDRSWLGVKYTYRISD